PASDNRTPDRTASLSFRAVFILLPFLKWSHAIYFFGSLRQIDPELFQFNSNPVSNLSSDIDSLRRFGLGYLVILSWITRRNGIESQSLRILQLTGPIAVFAT
ncbi:MAG: hypothetical protein AABZ02_09850, partial [Bacteroidota bacterium]